MKHEGQSNGCVILHLVLSIITANSKTTTGWFWVLIKTEIMSTCRKNEQFYSMISLEVMVPIVTSYTPEISNGVTLLSHCFETSKWLPKRTLQVFKNSFNNNNSATSTCILLSGMGTWVTLRQFAKMGHLRMLSWVVGACIAKSILKDNCRIFF